MFLSLIFDVLIIGKAVLIGASIGFMWYLIIQYLVDVLSFSEIMFKDFYKSIGKCVFLGGIVGPFAIVIHSTGWYGLALTVAVVGLSSAMWERINAYYSGATFNANQAIIDAVISIFSFVAIKLLDDNSIPLTERDPVTVIQKVSSLIVWGQIVGNRIAVLSGSTLGKTINKYTQKILNKLSQVFVKVRDSFGSKK